MDRESLADFAGGICVDEGRLTDEGAGGGGIEVEKLEDGRELAAVRDSGRPCIPVEDTDADDDGRRAAAVEEEGREDDDGRGGVLNVSS